MSIEMEAAFLNGEQLVGVAVDFESLRQYPNSCGACFTEETWCKRPSAQPFDLDVRRSQAQVQNQGILRGGLQSYEWDNARMPIILLTLERHGQCLIASRCRWSPESGQPVLCG